MLEAFLQQVETPVGSLSPVWLDWPLAAITFILVYMALTRFNLGIIVGSISSYLVLQYRWSTRKRQLKLQPAEFQADYDRWERVKRLRYLYKNQMLHNHVPAPVLSALERAARAWHDGREELRSSAASDPELALLLQKEVDAMMMVAASAAQPVVLSDEHGRKHLRQMEQDADLMSRICRRIEQEEISLGRLVDASQMGGSQLSLRDRLTVAQKERAAAEARLFQAWEGLGRDCFDFDTLTSVRFCSQFLSR